jgi:hypothetical protein
MPTLYQVIRYALTDIDSLLSEGFDDNVEDTERDGIRDTIEEISAALLQDKESAEWLKETYPTLYSRMAL